MNLQEITEAFVKLNKEDLIAKERKRLIELLRKVQDSATKFNRIETETHTPNISCVLNADDTPNILGSLAWNGVSEYFKHLPDLLVLEEGKLITYWTLGLQPYLGKVDVNIKGAPYANLVIDESDEEEDDEYDESISYHARLFAFSKETVKSDKLDLIAALSVAYPNVAALIN